MQVKESFAKGTLYLSLIGDMDEYSATEIRHKCDKIIDNNPTAKQVIFNLADVAFMDSTGIGFLIGRYKKTTRLGIAMYVEKPNLAADKVLNLSGIYSLIPKVDND
jgi:stage II sporulation protein AA (anti-sigma F factor antagonist)